MGLRSWLANASISPRRLGKYQAAAAPLKLLNGYSPLPAHVDLVLTFRCNCVCDMCVCRQEENAGVVTPFREPELLLEEWMAVVDDMAASFYFKPNMNLLGGEPSVYKGYLDLARYIKQKGFRCSYTTNGTFLARDAEAVVAAGVDVVVVSIDGLQEIHDSIRGDGTFERAIQGIRGIQEVKVAQRKSAPRVFLACSVNSHNFRRLADVVELAHELSVPYVNYLHLQFPDSEIGTHGIDVNALLGEMEHARLKADDAQVQIGFTPALRTDQIPTYYTRRSDQLGKDCVSPWLRMAVMPNGQVVSCKGFVVGDVRAEGTKMKHVWNCQGFRGFRRGVARPEALANCGRCCRKEY